MKKLSAAAAAALGIIGTLCVLTGISRDDMAEAAGQCYPFGSLMAWMAGGMLCMVAAWMIYELSERRESR